MGRKTQTWKPPDQSSLHDFCRTGSASSKRCKLVFLQKTTFVLTRQRRSAGAPNDWRRALRCMAASLKLEDGSTSVRTKYGGAERDRTADPLLAKQVLSQLSYSPNSQKRSIGNSLSRQAVSTKPVHQHHNPHEMISTASATQAAPPLAKANGGPG